TLVRVHPCHSWFAHSLASSSRHLRTPGFIKPGRLADREGRQVSRAPLPNSGVTSVGETWTASWEGITPPSSLVLAHAPLPLGSLLLRHLASFGESLQVVPSPCCPRQLPDVISENLSLDAGPHTPAVHRVLAPVSSTMSSAFPMDRSGRLPAFILRTTSRRASFRGCRYFVMFRPPSLLAPRIVPTAANTPQGSWGFYVWAYRASLPPHAPDMLTVRIQAIDGTGTLTPLDSQPCRLLRWDRDRARPAGGEGFPLLLFRLQDGFTVSPWRTFLDAPLKSRTARFPGSGSKPWHVLRGPSHGLERFKRWFVYTPATPGLPTASPPRAVICERPVLSSRAA